MVFCRILHYFVAESFFVIYVVLSRNMFLAIHALLRGEKFNKNLCPWRKNDKYELCGGSNSLSIGIVLALLVLTSLASVDHQ